MTVATAASQTLDPTVAWDALVIGGGATGAGLLRDLARRGMRDAARRPLRPRDRHERPVPRPAPFRRALCRARRRSLHANASSRTASCGGSRPLRSRTPAAISSPRPDDPDDYVDAFPALCAASDVDCEEVDVAEVLRTNPTLNPRIRRAFAVPDAAVEPWQLIEGNVADAAALGSAALPYHRVVGFDRSGERLLAARVVDVRSGTEYRVMAGQMVSAAGAWGGQVAAMAGAKLTMAPGKGTMLVFNQRMTDAVINRCHKPADGDIMVPVETVAILGTTDIQVADPDDWQISRAEVDELLDEGEKLFPAAPPDAPAARLRRRPAALRPERDRHRVARGHARARGPRSRHPRRDRQPDVDRGREAHDLPADGPGHGRRRRAQGRGDRAVRRRPRSRSRIRTATARRATTGSAAGSRRTRRAAAAMPT